MKIRFLATVFILLSAVCAHAGGTSCATATALVPDGTVLGFDNIQPNSSNWYRFTASAGRSYSVQVRDDVDPDNTDLTVTYYGPNSTCSSLQTSIPTSIASVTDTHAVEPALPASASRSSIVTCATNYAAPCTSNGGGTYWVKVQNTSTALSHYVNASVTETTQYNTGWSTYSNLTSYFQLQNTTSQCITYTLTLIPVAGSTQNTTTSGTVGTSCASSPATMVTRNTSSSDLNITSQAGAAILAHNGPPGAMQTNALSANFSTSPFSVVPLSMGPMRGK